MNKVIVLWVLIWTGVLSAHAQTCGLRDNGDGTMTDPGTGLQIMKCQVGRSWAGNACTGNPQYFKWDTAVQLHAQGTWRLITKTEAEKLSARTAGCGSQGWGLGTTWTSSPNPTDPREAWLFGMSNGGSVSLGGRAGTLELHLVRSGQAPQHAKASVVCGTELNAYIESAKSFRSQKPELNEPDIRQGVEDWVEKIERMTESNRATAIKNTKDAIDRERLAGHATSLTAMRTARNLLDICLIHSVSQMGDVPGRLNADSTSGNKSQQTTTLDQQSQQLAQQNQSRENQQLTQASQQSAQQNQSRADQQRQGKRKTHDPAAEAHECIAIDKAGSGNYGAFKNICNYPVNFSTCNEKPKTIQGGFNWSADFDCAKQQFGLHTPRANSSVAAHNRNTEFIYWFACKAPAMPTDVEYTPGKGLTGRCY